MPDNGILNGQQYLRKSCGTSSINDFGPRQCSVEAPDITGNWTVCLAICLRQQKRKHQTSRLLTLHNNQNGCDGVSNHQPQYCLLNRLFRRRSNKTSKLRVTGLCVGNSPVTGEFPAQMASNAENVFIWWRHHVIWESCYRGIHRWPEASPHKGPIMSIAYPCQNVITSFLDPPKCFALCTARKVYVRMWKKLAR